MIVRANNETTTLNRFHRELMEQTLIVLNCSSDISKLILWLRPTDAIFTRYGHRSTRFILIHVTRELKLFHSCNIRRTKKAVTRLVMWLIIHRHYAWQLWWLYSWTLWSVVSQLFYQHARSVVLLKSSVFSCWLQLNVALWLIPIAKVFNILQH